MALEVLKCYVLLAYFTFWNLFIGVMKDLRDEVQQPWLALFWQLILKGMAPAKYVTGFRVHQKSTLGLVMGHVLIFLNSKTSPSWEQESGTILFNIKEVSKAPFTKTNVDYHSTKILWMPRKYQQWVETWRHKSMSLTLRSYYYRIGGKKKKHYK